MFVKFPSSVQNAILVVRHKIVEKIRNRRRFTTPWLEQRINETIELLRTSGLGVPCEGEEAKMDDTLSSTFRLLVLSSSADLELAIHNIRHMKGLYGSEIRDITMVVADRAAEEASRLMADFEFEVDILSDSSFTFLQHTSIQSAMTVHRTYRHSWLRQQLIKIYFCYESEDPVLVLDSDLFFVRNIPLVHEMQELLFLNVGMHWQYNEHFSMYSGKTSPLLDFVAHFSVMKSHFLRQLFGPDIISGLVQWISIRSPRYEGSVLSEYQTYGNFVSSLEGCRRRFYVPKMGLYDIGFRKDIRSLQSHLEAARNSFQCDVVLVINKSTS